MKTEACSVGNCERVVLVRGLCSLHYHRLRRHGDVAIVLGSHGAGLGEPLVFLREVARKWVAGELDRAACIAWPYGLTTTGYGVVSHEGRQKRAHRVVLEMCFGPPPTERHEGAHLAVVCHNRGCVNPLHLSWKTVAENHADKVLDGTDLRGDRHPCSKLTEIQVREIFSSGARVVDLAREHGISQALVCNIKSGKRWMHLNLVNVDFVREHIGYATGDEKAV